MHFANAAKQWRLSPGSDGSHLEVLTDSNKTLGRDDCVEAQQSNWLVDIFGSSAFAWRLLNPRPFKIRSPASLFRGFVGIIKII